MPHLSFSTLVVEGEVIIGMQAAARFDDPIAHSSAESGLITGALLGAALVIGAALIIGTGGAAMPFVFGAILAGAALGGWIGEYAGSLSFFNKIAGKITSGSQDVFINYKPVARAVEDIGECSKHGPEPQQIATGSETVFINYRHAARVKDKLQCSGFIVDSSPDVFIGGGQARYTNKELGDEVAWQYHALVFGAGLAGALLMGGLAAVPAIVGGFAVGWAGGKLLGLVGTYYGDWLSENIGGQPEDWEKTGAFIGQAIGGWLGAKGGPKAWEVINRFKVAPNSMGMNGGNLFDPKAAAAKELLNSAKQSEPKITSDIQTMAKETDGKIEGLDYRLKSEQSLTRKLENTPPDQIKDAVRYTIVYDSKNISANANRVMNSLEQNGYERIRVKNTFGPDRQYQGINTNFRSPEGQVFELQFHTPESFNVKQNLTHGLYEELRILPNDSPKRAELQQQITNISNDHITPPASIDDVKDFP
jgi:uncharacterized Zn-binding protein involved in type VI secretion